MLHTGALVLLVLRVLLHLDIETGGSTRIDVHTDGRFRVGCTGLLFLWKFGGFQLDMGSPSTMRLQSGAGASGTNSASINVEGSNYHPKSFTMGQTLF